MKSEKQKELKKSAEDRGQPTSVNESGLSFEEEPTGIDASVDQGGSTGSDPGRSSPSAAFTPGPPAEAHNPFITPMSATLLIVVIALIVAAVWLL